MLSVLLQKKFCNVKENFSHIIILERLVFTSKLKKMFVHNIKKKKKKLYFAYIIFKRF